MPWYRGYERFVDEKFLSIGIVGMHCPHSLIPLEMLLYISKCFLYDCRLIHAKKMGLCRIHIMLVDAEFLFHRSVLFPHS